MARRHHRLTLLDATRAHEQALRKGGRAGILNEAGLLSALGRPYSGYYPRIAAKASALVEAIIRNHPFVDANKRTATILMIQLIRRSGYRLAPLPGEDLSRALEEMVVATAAGALDREAIEAWLTPRVARKG